MTEFAGIASYREDVNEKISLLRTGISEKKSKISGFNELPFSEKEIMERSAVVFDDAFLAHSDIIELRHRVSRFIRGDSVILNPHEMLFLWAFFVNREKTRKEFVEFMASCAAAQGGISRRERMKNVVALNKELHQMEMEEEQIISQAEDEGISITRRGDADPKVVLGVVDLEDLDVIDLAKDQYEEKN
jgi:hypothetical protein